MSCIMENLKEPNYDGIKETQTAELIQKYYSQLDEKGVRPKTKATAIQIGRPANILKGLRAFGIY